MSVVIPDRNETSFNSLLEALDVSIEEVVAGNVDKLKKRYPGGDFDVHYSENRKEGDR